MDDGRGACGFGAVYPAKGVNPGDGPGQGRQAAIQVEFQHQHMGGLNRRPCGLIGTDSGSDRVGRGLSGAVKTVAEPGAAGMFAPQGAGAQPGLERMGTGYPAGVDRLLARLAAHQIGTDQLDPAQVVAFPRLGEQFSQIPAELEHAANDSVVPLRDCERRPGLYPANPAPRLGNRRNGEAFRPIRRGSGARRAMRLFRSVPAT